MFEWLLLYRLNAHLEVTGGLSDSQYGFHSGRSTEDAIDEVLKFAYDAGIGAVQYRDLCLMASIDVRNAFNTAPWPKIDSALRMKKVPAYLIVTFRSYLSNRTLQISEGDTMPVTCGVPQVPVISPVLRNVFYDRLLSAATPPGIKIVTYADDVVVLARSKRPTD